MAVTAPGDWSLQMLIWGYAMVGELPRDPITRWLEGGFDSTALFDRTETYFQTTQVNGGRPPWWHALLPAVVGGLDPYAGDGVGR